MGAKWNPILRQCPVSRTPTMLPLPGDKNFSEPREGCTYQGGWRDPQESQPSPHHTLIHQLQSHHKGESDRKGEALQPPFSSEDDSIAIHCRHSGSRNKASFASQRAVLVITFRVCMGAGGVFPSLRNLSVNKEIATLDIYDRVFQISAVEAVKIYWDISLPSLPIPHTIIYQSIR